MSADIKQLRADFDSGTLISRGAVGELIAECERLQQLFETTSKFIADRGHPMPWWVGAVPCKSLCAEIPMRRSGCATLFRPGISRLVSSMKVISVMSTPSTSCSSSNATSSRALAAGPTPCASPVSRTMNLCGPAHVPASLSARLAKELGLTTSGTFGLTGNGSSISVALQKSMVSRLQARLLTLGSTLYTLTWKAWVTPSGVSRSRLRASAPRTSETALTGSRSGWVTTTRDWKDSGADIKPGGRRIGAIRPATKASEFSGLADSTNPGLERRRRASEKGDGRNSTRIESERFYDAGRMGDTDSAGPQQGQYGPEAAGYGRTTVANGGTERMEHAQGDGWQQRRSESGGRGIERRREPSELVVIDMDSGVRTGPTNGFWESADWLACRDGKWRPVEPGTFPLAHGAPARVGRLRAYGNAINVEQARIFIESFR